MDVLKVKISGASPLLQHNPRFANPLDPLGKEHKKLTGKRTKTEEDHLAIMKSEWIGGLYYNEVVGYHIPGDYIKATLLGAAKLKKKGMAFKRGVLILEECLPLNFADSKLPPDSLYTHKAGAYIDYRNVVVGQQRIMRCRPRFSDWSVTVEVMFDESQVDRDEIILAFENAGRFIGIGDYRPESGGVFGRFTCEVLQ